MNKKILAAAIAAAGLVITAIVVVATREPASNKEFTKVEGMDSLPHVSATIEPEKLKIPSVEEGHSVSYLSDYYGQAIAMNDRQVLSQLPKYDNSIAAIISHHAYPMTMVRYISRYEAKNCEFKESYKAIIAIAKNPKTENHKNVIEMLNQAEKDNIRKYAKGCLS